MTIAIDPTIFKTLRKARKIGRPKLAKLVGLTERQIMRLESTKKAQEVSPLTVERFSAAMQVPAGVLTGELPLVEEDLQQAVKPTCTSGCCG
ncbi:MAG: XRE family transcriptional regulator [Pseudoruegeria sp.]